MKKLAILGAILLLGGCAATKVILGISASPQGTDVAINVFDGAETIATGYLQLPVCGVQPCRNPTASKSIYNAVIAGRTARATIEGLLKANNGGAIPLATLDTLEGVNTTLQAIYSQYDIK